MPSLKSNTYRRPHPRTPSFTLRPHLSILHDLRNLKVRPRQIPEPPPVQQDLTTHTVSRKLPPLALLPNQPYCLAVLQHPSLQPAVADHAVRFEGVSHNPEGVGCRLGGVVDMGEDFERGEEGQWGEGCGAEGRWGGCFRRRRLPRRRF